MKDSTYWEKRVANKTWDIYNSLEERNKALMEIYKEASLDIEEELFQIAKKIKTSNPTLSDMHKYNRIGKLKDNINHTIKQLGKEVEKRTTNQITQAFMDNYSNTMKELGTLEYSLPNKKLIESLLKFPWSGENFSNRLWENTRVLERNLNEIMTRGLVQGKTIVEMSTELNDRMLKGFNESHRLVRTETMHYLNESSLRAYMDSGVKEVQFWAAVDERTCSKCGVKHGNPYKLKDAPVLPLHANCRCTYIPVADIEGGEEILANEEIKITKKESQNAYTVNRKLVNSKEYHDKFEILPLSKQVRENIYIESKKILEHRDGSEFEDLVILDFRTGKEIVSNRKSNSTLKTGISRKDYEKVMNSPNGIVLLHNHPGGGRLSIADILTVFKQQNVFCSVVAGHDGSLHYICEMNRKIDIEDKYNKEYNKLKISGIPQGLAILKATDKLYESNLFNYHFK